MKDNKKQLWQVIKFTLFSISAGVIQVASFALLELFVQTYWIPYLISLLMSKTVVRMTMKLRTIDGSEGAKVVKLILAAYRSGGQRISI